MRQLTAPPLPGEHVADVLAVAMTRPKRHLCVVGDAETVGRYVLP